MPATPLSPEAFQRATGVSGETLDRLRAYEVLLRKWQASINLVGRSTLDNLWGRHVLDSAQLLPLAPASAKVWVDVGSGAGFPGLVLSILGAPDVHLVEADARKAAFLREAVRATGAGARVHAVRVEDVSRETLGGSVPDLVTARGLASPAALLAQTAHLVTSETTYLVLAGQGARGALTEARKVWKMRVDECPSQSDPSSWVLRIQGVSRG
jgi:16S rRNA (guanine527-N7)-methyltransferase